MRLSIPPAAGVDIFARILASRFSRVVVSPFDVVQAIAQSARVQRAGAERPSAAIDMRRATTQPRVGRFDPPTTDLERRLAAIWSELLGVEPIGLHDNFFDLGGHSLLGTRVLARIDDTLNVRLKLRDVFDSPTIHQLAERISTARSAAADSGTGEAREEIVL